MTAGQIRVGADHRACRSNEFDGVQEIVTPLPVHERENYRLGRFIDVMTEEAGIAVVAGRSTTFRKRSRRRHTELKATRPRRYCRQMWTRRVPYGKRFPFFGLTVTRRGLEPENSYWIANAAVRRPDRGSLFDNPAIF
jgi:hypothetical protein